MRKIFSLALFLLSPLLASAGGGFLTGVEDVPLPPQLTELSGGGMVFDSPGGRIVEASASGTMSAEQVKQFYADTLPQLGWQRDGDSLFRRDNETLRLVFEPQKGATLVRFTLTPNH